MKSKDIARSNHLDNTAFDNWLKQSGHRYKSGVMGGLDVDDSQNIDEIVSSFREHVDKLKRLAEIDKAAEERAAQEKQRLMASMLITSGFAFDGYTITKYSGYISGDDALQVDRGTQHFFGGATNVADSLMAALVKIRRTALTELKEAALALGCNAVIGVDFDYITLDPETANSQGGTVYLPYVFGVTANGNAVIIEKNEQTAPL